LLVSTLALMLVSTLLPTASAQAQPTPAAAASDAGDRARSAGLTDAAGRPDLTRLAERELGARTAPGARAAAYAFYRDETGALVVEGGARFGQTLRQEYGNGVRTRPLTISRSGRTNDQNPHYGGARLHLANYTGGCTAGVALLRAGVRHMVTAGHCYAVNARIYSGPHYYGLVNIRRFPSPDLALINGNPGGAGQGGQGYANVVYTNPSAPSLRTVSTRWNTVVGHSICTGGSYSNERCGARVNSVAATFCDSDGCTYNLARARNPGKLTAQLGDSGGPVYQKVGGSGLAFQGITIATSLNLSSVSGDTVWFHTLRTIESTLGGTVVTSRASIAPTKG
jgi:hypothetical protein